MTDLPLLRRFPALDLPRAHLGSFPTPVQRVALHDGRALLVKRDDLSANPIGGNKVRGLEWLLGGVRPGDRVLTVGPRGSTHALATATYAKQLGASTTVVRWNQEMNDAARAVDEQTRVVARVIDANKVVAAYVMASLLRLHADRWIPAGGASPIAILGHVNAALELCEQLDRGDVERPSSVVVPFGTGGTAAGIALGLRLASVELPVVAVRVVPRIVARRARIMRLVRAAEKILGRASREPIPPVSAASVVIDHGFYGGAYGRPLVSDARAEFALWAIGVGLDDTYSRKAFSAAIARDDRLPLLWLTFDGRIVAPTPTTHEHSA